MVLHTTATDNAAQTRDHLKDAEYSTVVEIPLTKLDGYTVSIEQTATPQRFRLLDCTAFIDSGILRVIEFFEFKPKAVRYAAISYPWRDLQLHDGNSPLEGCFKVHGAEHADAITIGVLRTACVAARYFGATLLWLDRLCIMQANKPDKTWQIEKMYSIYAHSDPCLVLPGGLVRLARLDEPTTWTDRAWTLQEAAANLRRGTIKCVFSFPHASFSDFALQLPEIDKFGPNFKSHLCNASHAGLAQHIIEANNSASSDLMELFTEIYFVFQSFEIDEPELFKDYTNFPIRIISPLSARFLSQSLVTDEIINYQYFWMSAFVRSSSRPVDMVFSIMGPMGVQLSVAEFEASDRKHATIKLIQALLRRGRAAEWLFVAPELPPSPELSILPVFPETSVSGRALVKTPQGMRLAFEEIALKEPWNPYQAPRGTMSDSGYFTFTARGALVVNTAFSHERPNHGSSSVETWAAVIGRRREHNRDPETGRITFWNPDNPFPVITELTLMFMEKHGLNDNGQDIFHRVGMENRVDESKTTAWSWVEREFSVGGPGTGERVRFGTSPEGPIYLQKVEE